METEILIKKRDFSQGIVWLKNANKILSDNYFTWLGIMVFGLVLVFLFGCVPGVGEYLSSFIGNLYMGLILLCAHKQAQAGELQFSDVFTEFSKFRKNLILTILLIMVLTGILDFASDLVAGTSIKDFLIIAKKSDISQITQFISAHGMQVMFGFLLKVFLGLLLQMFSYFAINWTIFKNKSPIDSLMLSYRLIASNVSAFICSSLVSLLAIVGAVVTLGLGFLYVVPLFIIMNYSIFADVVLEER